MWCRVALPQAVAACVRGPGMKYTSSAEAATSWWARSEARKWPMFPHHTGYGRA